MDLPALFDNLKDAEISTDTFSFFTSVSAIASSRIEGEKMEIDSYIKHKMLNVDYLPDLVQKPDDLYKAYLFAQQNELNTANFLKAHQILTEHLLPPAKRGKLRTGNMLVMEHNTGRIRFEAAPGTDVSRLSEMLWNDIALLSKQNLTHTEVFFFAVSVHLVFANIHPFEDGNGRAARLLEKWFIAEKLDIKAWHLQSELNYYNNVDQYYKNLNRPGVFFGQLDYSKSLPFLLMLPQSFDLNK